MKKKFVPIDDLAKEWLKNPEFRAEYDLLDAEFTLAVALIEARGGGGTGVSDEAGFL